MKEWIVIILVVLIIGAVFILLISFATSFEDKDCKNVFGNSYHASYKGNAGFFCVGKNGDLKSL